MPNSVETLGTKTLKDWGIKPLHNYGKDGKIIVVKTVNAKKFEFKMLDYDKEEWFMGKQIDNRYRRIKRQSIYKIEIKDVNQLLSDLAE